MWIVHNQATQWISGCVTVASMLARSVLEVTQTHIHMGVCGVAVWSLVVRVLDLGFPVGRRGTMRARPSAPRVRKVPRRVLAARIS